MRRFLVRTRSVRVRLVLGATAFAAVAICVALVAGRWMIAAQIEASAVSLAQGDLSAYLAELNEHSRGGDADSGADGGSISGRTHPPASGSLIEVRDGGGTTVVDTMPDAVSAAIAQHPDDDSFTVGDDDRAWVVVAARGQAPHGQTVWAARDVTGQRATLATIDALFIAGGLVLVGLFAGAAALFVRAALRPIEVMRVRERQMVSDAAHELRTPLAGLRAQLELARRSAGAEGSADVEDQLRRAQESATRIGDLASNLLELARLEERTERLTASGEDIRAVFLAVVDDVRATPEASAVIVDQASDPVGGEGEVGMDAVSFGRVVQNLLSNAVRAAAATASDRGGTGTVSAELRFSAGAVTVTVADDGPGMSEDFLARATERFTREHPSDGSGSGLGLALVAALVDAAGGRLDLENTAPGVRASVRLPLSPRDGRE